MSEPLLRWYTKGMQLPVEVVVGEYRGAGIWLCRWIGGGWELEIDDEYLYADKGEALRAYIKFVEQLIELEGMNWEAVMLQARAGLAIASSRLEEDVQ